MICEECPTSIAQVQSTRAPVTCACGEAYVPKRPLRPRVTRQTVFHAPPDATSGPAERAGESRLRSVIPHEDPDLVMLRRLLADLRPDCPDPMVPPQREPLAPTAIVRTPAAPWDRLPAGLGSNTAAVMASMAGAERGAADVLARLYQLPPDAAQVLRWLRDHAHAEAGARAIFAEVGMHFAAWAGDGVPELWDRSLGARREGAPAHGRRLVLRAEALWRK